MLTSTKAAQIPTRVQPGSAKFGLDKASRNHGNLAGGRYWWEAVFFAGFKYVHTPGGPDAGLGLRLSKRTIGSEDFHKFWLKSDGPGTPSETLGHA